MKGRFVLVLLALVAAAALAWWALRSGGGTAERPREAVATPSAPTPGPGQRIMLLFPGTDGLLHPELRQVALPTDVDERAMLIVNELLAGPRSGLLPAVPWQATLLDLFVDDSGIAYVDLSGPPAPLAGSNVELMVAYSIVDSVLLNCPELHSLQILMNGHEIPTLTGHLDFSRPLVLNKRFISKR
ncbi:MAG: GerMN domain-containing protein [Acidobacteria bacterium]|nr:GerMN domain-containing protein [Acidobacteriota bacterium]